MSNADAPTPFSILLRDNDWIARKEACEAIYDSRHFEGRKLLQQSLSHPDERIRLFAAQALEKMSERHMRRIESLRLDIKNEPSKNFDKRLQLAHALGEYALMIGDTKQAQDHVFREAVEELNALLRIFPTRQDLLLELARVYMSWVRLTEADQILQKIKKDTPEFVEATFRRAEIAMKNNRPESIRPLLDKIRTLALPPEFQEAVQYWCANPWKNN